MLLFIRDNECFEPRVQNYLNYFDKNNISYKVVAWNRNGTAAQKDKFDYFRKRAEYGKRIANIPNKIKWMSYVIKEIIKYKKDIDVIHACDIDAVLPALFIGHLFHKKVIFDIFDWIDSLTGKGLVYKLVDMLQNYSYKHSDYVILCEEERKKQAKAENESVYVLPNIPDGKTVFDDKTLEITSAQRTNYKIVISYVGVFDRDRGLENLLQCVSELPDVLLNIAGFGVLDDLIRNYSDKYTNICYWGRVDYPVSQSIMKNSDLLAAMYYLTSPLHKYAAPNKYYESLYLGVPMITTLNTLVGNKTLQFDTGFVIDESKDSLYELLTNGNIFELIEIKKKNCSDIWENNYSTYFNKFMKDSYRNILMR